MTENSSRLFLFYGYGCEYSLSPLARYMKDNNHNVLEIDLLKTKNVYDLLKEIRGKDIVFITSWHMFFDKMNFDFFVSGDKDREVMSPLEVIDFLNPSRSIYYPHDLTDFMHEQEWTWLDLFDAAMVPFKSNDYFLMKKYTRIYNVGWIKKTKQTTRYERAGKNLRTVYFPSHTSYIKSFSPEEYFMMLEPILNAGAKIKFPQIGGLDRHKNMLADKGAEMIDASKTVFDIIDDCQIVISTGSSSVMYEAGLSGRPVITIMDGVMSPEQYNEVLPDYSWLYKCNFSEAAALIEDVRNGKKSLYYGEDILKPMNFALAEKIVIGDI